MTAVIIPITNAVAIVGHARTILRSAVNHTDETLAEACQALRDYGDWKDHMEADAMMLAIRLRRSRRAHEAKPQPGLIRGALFETAVFVGAAVAVVFWVLAQGGM
jgi:hypothetical protein